MKSFMKLAVCGLIAVAVQANAQQVNFQAVTQSPAARAFLTEALGVTSFSTAELSAAMAKLSTAQRATVLAAINQFNAKAVSGTSAAAVASNEALAKQIFAKVSTNLKTASLVDSTPGSCSREELASKLIDGTSVSYASALAALNFWNGRVSVGECGSTNPDALGLIGYNAQARENFLKAAIIGMDSLNGKKDFSAETAKSVWADALAKAKNETGSEKTTAAAEMATVQSLEKNCKILKLN